MAQRNTRFHCGPDKLGPDKQLLLGVLVGRCEKMRTPLPATAFSSLPLPTAEPSLLTLTAFSHVSFCFLERNACTPFSQKQKNGSRALKMKYIGGNVLEDSRCFVFFPRLLFILLYPSISIKMCNMLNQTERQFFGFPFLGFPCCVAGMP